MILKKYEHVYKHDSKLLKLPNASLSPLSSIMADLFDQFADEEVLVSLALRF